MFESFEVEIFKPSSDTVSQIVFQRPENIQKIIFQQRRKHLGLNIFQEVKDLWDSIIISNIKCLGMDHILLQ